MSYDALPFGTHCNCKKSRCLKLYCVCFMGGMYCNGCPCCECLNTVQHADTVQHERIKILRRSPRAFTPKVLADQSSGEAAHKKGCRCKKSRCLKKYCECYDAGAPCSSICKCVECLNQPDAGGPSEPPDAITLALRQSNREAVARMAAGGASQMGPAPPMPGASYDLGQASAAAHSGGLPLQPGMAAHGSNVYGMAQAADVRSGGAGGRLPPLPPHPTGSYEMAGPTAAAGRRQRRPSSAMMDYETGEEHDDDEVAWRSGSLSQQQQQQQQQVQQQQYAGHQLPSISTMQSMGPSQMSGRRLEHTASFPPSRQESPRVMQQAPGVPSFTTQQQPHWPLASHHVLGPTSDVLPALHGLESQPRSLFPGAGMMAPTFPSGRTPSDSSLGPLSGDPLMESFGSLGGANTDETALLESWHMHPHKAMAAGGKEPSGSTARGPFAIAAGQSGGQQQQLYGQQPQFRPASAPPPSAGPAAQAAAASPHHDYHAAGFKRPSPSRQPDPTPEMLLRPEVLLSDPDYAMMLASRLGGDAAHMQAARKAASILKSMLDLARNNQAFLSGAPVAVLRQQQPLPGVSPAPQQPPPHEMLQFQHAPAPGGGIGVAAAPAVSAGVLPVAMSNMSLHVPRGAAGSQSAWPGGARCSSDISSSGKDGSSSGQEGSSSDKDTGEAAQGQGRAAKPDRAPSTAFQGLDVSGPEGRPSGSGAPNRNSSSGGGAVHLGRGGNYHFSAAGPRPSLPPALPPGPSWPRSAHATPTITPQAPTGAGLRPLVGPSSQQQQQQQLELFLSRPPPLSAQTSLTDMQLPPKRPRLVSDDATMTEGMVPSSSLDMGDWGTATAHTIHEEEAPRSAEDAAITQSEAEALQMLIEMRSSSLPS